MLETCLDSVVALTPRPLEIIVIIDGECPDVAAAANARGLRCIALPTRPGVSAARNAGAAEARGSVLVFFDSDVQLPEDCLLHIGRHFASNPGLSAAFGSYDDTPLEEGIVTQYRNLLHHFTHQTSNRQAQTFWTGCGAIRRRSFIELGGFDPSYRLPSVEDIELGYRLSRSGASIELIPDWQVKHLKRWEFSDLVLTDLFKRAIPWTRLLAREHRLDNDLNIGHRARVSATLLSLSLLCLLVAIFYPPALTVATVAVASCTALNLPFLTFLRRRGGIVFAVLATPLLWLYFLVGTVGFVMGHLTHAWEQFRAPYGSREQGRSVQS
jgi:glycosyltransferase involved in cell wall biosynthesis